MVWHSGASGKQNRVLARSGLQCQSRRGDFPVTLITLKSKAFGSPFLYPIPCHLVARINKQAKAIRNVCVTPASVRDEWISIEKMSASPYHYTHAQERKKTGGEWEGTEDTRDWAWQHRKCWHKLIKRGISQDWISSWLMAAVPCLPGHFFILIRCCPWFMSASQCIGWLGILGGWMEEKGLHPCWLPLAQSSFQLS